ncbi:MAG: PadR family transcriptional regulator [Candidatus Izemoplasmatales bacterium]|nr:PadR family transcriptional regulator [Candidatus Izemoplasmatales bacterium]HPD99719.1 PadR family transcriptional regulator [Bacillota bacterium]
MTNSGEFIRGFTDYIILSILSKFDSYGYEMSKIIEFVSDNNIQLTEASLYIALKRLLNDEKISTYTGKNKKGMSRRYYQITPKGKKELKAFRKDWVLIENTLSSLFGGNFEYFRES